MGKDTFTGGSIGNERLAHRASRGWSAPREERANDRFEPDMDRLAIDSNDETLRSHHEPA